MRFLKLLSLLLLTTPALAVIPTPNKVDVNAPFNYLPNGGCERGIVGFKPFSVSLTSSGASLAPTGAPTTIANTGTVVQIQRLTTSTSVLDGNASCQMQVGSSYASITGSTAYGVITDAFTVANKDLAKMLSVTMDYAFATNAANVDASGSSTQTVEVWVYNTNLGWFQPANFRSLITKTGSGRTPGVTFQTDSSSTNNQYRIALIAMRAPSGTFNLTFDNLRVTNQATLSAPAVSDWVSFTPTWSGVNGATVQPAIGNGTLTGWYRRVGDSAQVYIQMYSGSTTTFGTGGMYGFSIPSGLTIDTTKSSNNGARTTYGSGTAYGPTGYTLSCTNWSTSTVAMNAAATGPVSPTSPATWSGAAVSFDLNCTLPIVGWSSNTSTSADYDGRITALRIEKSGSTSYTGDQKVTTFRVTNDTHGGFDSTNYWYKIPTSGWYTVTMANAYGLGTVTNIPYIRIYNSSGTLQGNVYFGVQSAVIKNNGSVTRYFNAGDYFEFWVYTASALTLNDDSTSSYYTVTKIPGNSTVQASESVEAAYEINSAQSINGSTVTAITAWNKVKDTHNAFSNGVFTAPISGMYTATLQVSYGGTVPTSVQAILNPSSGNRKYGYTAAATVPAFATSSVTANFYLLAGQTLTTQTYQGSTAGTSVSLNNDTGQVFFSIVRTGN